MARRRRRSKLVVFTFLASFIISLKVIPMYIDFIPEEESLPPRNQVKMNNITSDQTVGIKSKEVTKLSKDNQASKDKITKW